MVERLAKFVVHHRKLVMLIYLFAVLVSLYGLSNLKVNYDIFSYLPQNLNSVRGFKILMDKFGLGNTVQVIVPTEELKEVRALVEEIKKIKGIKSVDYAGDFVDETVPVEFTNGDIVRSYVKNGYSLVRVSFSEPAASPQTEKAFIELKKICDRVEAKIAGSVATNFDMKMEVQSSLRKFAISAVVLVSIVLLLSLPSFVIPLTFVFAIGISALINIGVSYFFSGEVSYFARVIAFPLQFAVTMDYALFLYHRFEEELSNGDPEQAMVKSIITTFKSVSSAAATTIAGFVALSFMKLGFGKDIGQTLARGVLISLVAIVTLLPALILELKPLIRKLTHRIFIPDFSFLGNFSARHSVTISVAGVLFFILSYFLYQQINLSFDFKAGIPETAPSQKASEILAKKFGSKTSAYLVYKNDGEESLGRKIEKISELEHVSGVFGYDAVRDPLVPDIMVPEEIKEKFFKDGYTYLIVNFDLDQEDKRLPETIEKIRKLFKKNEMVYLSGEVVMLEDLKKITFEDLDRVNFYSSLAIFAIIMIAFRSVTIPLILITVIQTSILFNQGIFAILGEEMSFIGALAIGAIQLGSTVDYAILLTSRFEEELKNGNSRLEAVVKAVKEATRPIMTSALTMFFATIGMYVFGRIGTIKELGLLISRGALISFLTVIIFLPAFLYLAQPLIKLTSLRWPEGGKQG